MLLKPAINDGRALNLNMSNVLFGKSVKANENKNWCFIKRCDVALGTYPINFKHFQKYKKVNEKLGNICKCKII